MRFTELYRPKHLADIIGQPCVRKHLMPLVRNPKASCWLFTGAGGVGKSACALALAADLGIDKWDIHKLPASELDIDQCRGLFGGMLRYIPKNGWKMLVIEELDALPSDQVLRFLKTKLETASIPESLIVVATSNDISGLDRPFLQRFQVCEFECGPAFAVAMRQRLAVIWQQVSTAPMPPESRSWGKDGNGWSMRVALDECENYLASQMAEVAA